MSFPPASCMCLTYGRPHLLEEAIESFLRQDYAGEKELIVLNDFAQQELRFNHPEVKVINVPQRFNSVGEKRNACAALCSHDWLFVWDDDDLYLPWRLSYSMAKITSEVLFYKANRAYILNGTERKGPRTNLFHSASCFHRSFFNAVHGYDHMGSGQDLQLELRMREHDLAAMKVEEDIPDDEIYYIYRWYETRSYHLSGFGKDLPGELSGNTKVEEFVQGQIKRGRVKTGEIELNPQWKADYLSLF